MVQTFRSNGTKPTIPALSLGLFPTQINVEQVAINLTDLVADCSVPGPGTGQLYAILQRFMQSKMHVIPWNVIVDRGVRRLLLEHQQLMDKRRPVFIIILL